MIVYDLKCARNHVFEAWFSDAASYEKLRKAGHVSCSVCNSTKVERALVAPQISTRKGKKANDKVPAPAKSKPPQGGEQYATDPQAVKAGELMKQLTELRKQVEKNCDYVGESFPEEARKIHYGEAPHRNIYGEASATEAQELADEGVEFSRIPWAPRKDA